MIEETSVLWLAGWSAPPSVWQPVIDRFSRSDPRIRHQLVDVHTLLEGESGMPQQDHDWLDDGVWWVVGWSMGGMMALEWARMVADRIRGVFAIGVTDQFVRSPRSPDGWDERVLRRMERRLPDAPEQVLADFDRRMFSLEEEKAGWPIRWRQSYRNQQQPDVSGLLAGLHYLQRYSFPDSPLSVPVFLLHGEDDAICPVSGARRLARMLPEAELTVWKGAGHLPFWTQPERFHFWLKERMDRATG
ncbi:alpha/beta fold hydrolase [Polycladomyces subterraneus]|uniref:Alpha/beta hydrolase n=1 Tax=Polycladomyces subterraneus TaxID=1016997 RepID=A0ABT8INE7_9BACL|nr:alpha/beta hydrolase [Polycladomyces subterraneus]MDN4594267.1 alpha/beta hydrolase [Polycladomyces subterraneus]